MTRILPKPVPLALAATVAVLGFCAADRGAFPAAAAAEARPARSQPGSAFPGGRGAFEGQASYYARHFTGRPMANGQRFDPNSNSAAHRSLPFGTPVQVTNLANGRSAVVIIRDRGPFTGRRVLDVSPRTAEVLGMRGAGVARVVARTLGGERVEMAEAAD